MEKGGDFRFDEQEQEKEVLELESSNFSIHHDELLQGPLEKENKSQGLKSS